MNPTDAATKPAVFSRWNMVVFGLLFVLGIGFAAYTKAQRVAPMELATLNGPRVSLPGQGLSWVNFWSISCPPCLKEMPYLEKLHQEYQSQDRVQIVAVSVPYDPPNVIKDYQTRENLTLPMAMDPDGWALKAFTDKLVVPSHYLVDEKGNILLTHLGEIDEAAIRAAIEKYL